MNKTPIRWEKEIEPVAYEEAFFSNIPHGPEGVVSRIIMRTPRRRWWHRVLRCVGWYRLLGKLGW